MSSKAAVDLRQLTASPGYANNESSAAFMLSTANGFCLRPPKTRGLNDRLSLSIALLKFSLDCVGYEVSLSHAINDKRRTIPSAIFVFISMFLCNLYTTYTLQM